MLEEAEDVVANTVDVEASEEKSDDKVVVPFDDEEGLLALSAVSCFWIAKWLHITYNFLW